MALEAEAGDLTQTTPGLLSTSAAGEAGAASGADNTDNYADTDKAVSSDHRLGSGSHDYVSLHCIIIVMTRYDKRRHDDE